MVQARAEETYRLLLEAAQAAFAELGYEGAGVAEVCRRAGVSKGAFYHHFPSKQALFLALLEAWLGQLDATIEALKQRPIPVPDKLLALADLVEVVLAAGREQLPLFLDFWSQAVRDPVVSGALQGHYQRYQQTFALLLDAGVAESSLKPMDTQKLARSLVALGVGVVLQGLLDPQPDWGETTRQGLKALLDGIRREA